MAHDFLVGGGKTSWWQTVHVLRAGGFLTHNEWGKVAMWGYRTEFTLQANCSKPCVEPPLVQGLFRTMGYITRCVVGAVANAEVPGTDVQETGGYTR